jgi:hypothetical protein
LPRSKKSFQGSGQGVRDAEPHFIYCGCG